MFLFSVYVYYFILKTVYVSFYEISTKYLFMN